MRWALVGAGLGALAVLVVAVIVILLTGSNMELMAVAGFSAGFGGTGFGAMLGAVLAALREPDLQPCR